MLSYVHNPYLTTIICSTDRCITCCLLALLTHLMLSLSKVRVALRETRKSIFGLQSMLAQGFDVNELQVCFMSC